jgi:hypothetical protein
MISFHEGVKHQEDSHSCCRGHEVASNIWTETKQWLANAANDTREGYGDEPVKFKHSRYDL